MFGRVATPVNIFAVCRIELDLYQSPRSRSALARDPSSRFKIRARLALEKPVEEAGLLWQITNLQKYIWSRTMSGSYIYDVVWCGLEMIENKQKQF